MRTPRAQLDAFNIAGDLFDPVPDFVDILSTPIIIAGRVCGCDREKVIDMADAGCPVCHGRGTDGWGKPCKICSNR